MRSAIHSAHRDVRLVPLDPPATFALDLLWRDPPRPAVGTFAALAAAVAGAEGWLAT